MWTIIACIFTAVVTWAFTKYGWTAMKANALAAWAWVREKFSSKPAG